MIKNIIIIIGILLFVGLGFLFVTSMTGNAIGGLMGGNTVLHNDYFKISDFGNSLNDSVDKVKVVLGDVEDRIK